MRFPAPNSLYLTISVAICSSLALAEPSLAQDVDVEEVEEEEEIIVQATRSGRRVQDEPIRVEVLNREEIEEKMLMNPSNISMLVSETGGIRVQVTSPALGASNVRVQGLSGRYTQILSDGLPLYGGQASSIGLLQIAPTDLGQVEIIKGAASALYGPSALGGVINLVSRRPTDVALGEVLLNATSRNGQDVTAYASAPINDAFDYSLTTGLHRQTGQDLDRDGWLDLSGYKRTTFRPRVFFEGENGETAFLTIGAMAEQRRGGTTETGVTPNGRSFPQREDAVRFDAGFVGKVPVSEYGNFNLRAAGVIQGHDHLFGDIPETDQHQTLFGEASYAYNTSSTSWLAGIAIQSDSFDTETFPLFNYSFVVPAIFGQIEHDVADGLRVAASARTDFHNEYGTKISPRISVVYKPAQWTIRASIGRGFYAPTPFVEEIEAAGFSRLETLTELDAETATTASLDVGYANGPLEANATLFGSNISNAVYLKDVVVAGEDRVALANSSGLTKTRGLELLLRYKWENVSLSGSYVFVDATERTEAAFGRRLVPLTPKHSAGVVAMWEKHGKGRIGLEAYYTGVQSLDDNPVRTRSKPYFDLGALGEIIIGKFSVFLNAENLLDIRQTKYESLLRPQRADDGRWTVDAWAPLGGFTVNGGVRVKFGG